MREVDCLHRVPLLEARRERRQVVVVERHGALFGLDALLHPAGRDAGRLVRDRRVQRIELVLHEELPVRVLDHAVADRHDLDLAERRAVAHVVEGDLRFAEEFDERRAFGGEAREHEAAVGIDACRALHAAVGVVARHPRAFVALGERDRAHRAVEVEAPRVVRADEGAAGVPLQVADQLRAAVRAAVVEHVHLAVLTAHHDHRLAADLHGVVVAGLRHLRLVAAVDPDAFPDLLHLDVEDLPVGVDRLVDTVGFDKCADIHRRNPECWELAFASLLAAASGQV